MSYLEHMDEENPVGVLAVTTGKLRKAIEELPADLALLDEREIRRQINPTTTDYCLRTAFWREYERVVRKNGPFLRAADVIRGVCSDAYFYQKFVKDPWRVAWLVRPMQTYQAEIEAVLVKGTERLWELMEMDITYVDKTGKTVVDAKRANVLLEAIKMVEARAKGHAVIRSDSRALVAQMPLQSSLAASNDQKVLEQRMAELSKKIHGTDITKVRVDTADINDAD